MKCKGVYQQRFKPLQATSFVEEPTAPNNNATPDSPELTPTLEKVCPYRPRTSAAVTARPLPFTFAISIPAAREPHQVRDAFRHGGQVDPMPQTKERKKARTAKPQRSMGTCVYALAGPNG